jgi:PAS domain S-box-containing protein
MGVVKNTILIVEDNAGLNELLSEKIQDCGYDTYSVYSAVEAFEWLEVNEAFIMLLDFSLPDLNGKEFIEWLISGNISFPPFIVATGQGDERIAVQMMKLGARDYVLKDNNFLELIPMAIDKVSIEIQKEQKLKLIENELAESYQFNKQIIKSAQEGIVVYDLDLKYQVWNPFMEKITGVLSINVLGKYVLDVLPFVEEEKLTENLSRALKGEQNSETEFYFSIPETGKSGWVTETIAPLRNAENQIIGAIAVVHDITERKNAEKEIEKIGKHYQSIIEKAPDGFVLLNRDGRFKYISPSGKRIFGYAESDEIYAHPNDSTHPDDLPMVLSHLAKLVEDAGYTPKIEYRIANKSDNWVWIESTFSNLLSDPNVESIVINFRDITERKLAEMQLLESESRYHTLFNSSFEAIFLTSPDGSIISANPSACEMFMMNEEEIIQKGRNGIIDVTDPRLVAALEIREETGKFNGELNFVRANGEKFPCDISSSIFIDKEGNNRTSTIIRDASERKNTELLLQENRNMLHKLLFTSTEFIDSSSNTIDYERITEIARELSGAKFASFNLYNENGHELETVAFTGLSNFQEKAVKYLGFQLINKKWDFDPARIANIQDNVITEFESLDVVVQNAIPKRVLNKIIKLFKLGKMNTVKINKNNKNIGDLNMLMAEGVNIKNPEILELFANQVGLFIQRHNSDEKLRKNEEKYRILFAENPQPMFIYDLETLDMLEVNQTALDFYGYSREEFLTLNIKELLPNDAHPVFLEANELTRKGLKTDGISKHIKKNGELIVVETFTVAALSMGPDARHVLVVDITKRKLAEEALNQKMEELMRFHHLTVGREHTMIELKREINRILIGNGELAKYKIVE